MAYDLPGLIARIHQFEPKANVHLSEAFASNREGHRAKIRQSIAETLKAGPEIHDLKSLPHVDGWSISISHCKNLGGWIAIPRPARVGFDIELTARLSDPVIERISQPGELQHIPDPRFLWCAKESYYKALEQRQPDAVTQIRIENWQIDPAGEWRFSSRGLRGSLFSAVDLLVSVALVELP